MYFVHARFLVPQTVDLFMLVCWYDGVEPDGEAGPGAKDD
jgi:hypothetical protein